MPPCGLRYQRGTLCTAVRIPGCNHPHFVLDTNVMLPVQAAEEDGCSCAAEVAQMKSLQASLADKEQEASGLQKQIISLKVALLTRAAFSSIVCTTC